MKEFYSLLFCSINYIGKKQNNLTYKRARYHKNFINYKIFTVSDPLQAYRGTEASLRSASLYPVRLFQASA